jgi:hypothetical protein
MALPGGDASFYPSQCSVPFLAWYASSRVLAEIGSQRLTRLISPLVSTSTIFHAARRTDLVRLRRRWRRSPLLRTSLPEPVSLKRLAVALWVFNLGTFEHLH